MLIARGWGKGGMRSYYLMGIELRIYKMKSSVDGVHSRTTKKCTQCHQSACLKMVKMMYFMLCIFYQNKMEKDKNKCNIKVA